MSLRAELSHELAELAAAGAAGVVGVEHRRGQGSGVVLSPDGYVLGSEPDRVHVTTAPGNAGGNLRLLFWPGDAPVQADGTSCATWSDATTDLAQQTAGSAPEDALAAAHLLSTYLEWCAARS